ncbi:MAG: long-chain acyl-CoA synthetase [Alphaproteobacteria bacterium]|jgi:long-chain acyl-CoA synthetase
MTKATDLIALDETRTLDGLFRERVRRTPEAPAYRAFNLATDAWEGITWATAVHEVARWQAALAGEGLSPGDRVAVMLPGGFAWVYFEQAAIGLGLVVVPIFARDRPGNAAYILKHSGARLVLIGTDEDWRLIAAEDDDLAAVSRIVTLDSAVGSKDARLAALDDWLPTAGGALIGTNDGTALATLVYTSGTSGPPKGVMLSHKNILANVAAGLKSVPVFPDDIFLSFLPLNHMLERTVGYYVPMMAGAEVAFVREIPKIAEDLQTIRPTCIVSVPRIYDRVYDKIVETLATKPAPLRWLAHVAAHVGWRAFEHTQGRAIWAPDLLLAPLLDRLVAVKVRAAFGGRLRVAITGGAALAGDVARFLIGQGVPILQGYGLTELSPVASVNTATNNDPLSVGPALAGVEIRIAPGGEILVRGDLLMIGYWQNDKATDEAVDAEGWLHTGDIGRIFEDKLYIQGRIKDIIVLDTGEKIAPTDMEEAIAADAAIDQVLVAGEGHPYLIAIVVQAGKVAIDEAALLTRIEQRCRNFPGYARIRQVIVADVPWTLENDLMTATLKLKRQKILDLYADRIAALYQGADVKA